MGTRSVTIVLDESGNPIVRMYRQMDGYPEGMGRDIVEKFGEFKLINGIGGGDHSKEANGMGCFAGQVVAHFKDGIGDIYLCRPDDDMGIHDEEYAYIIYPNKMNILCITVYDVFNKYFLYDGLLSMYQP